MERIYLVTDDSLHDNAFYKESIFLFNFRKLIIILDFQFQFSSRRI